MKFNKITSVCKKDKCILIYNLFSGSTVTQWLGNAAAMYRLEGTPEITPDELLVLLDIPAKKRSDWSTSVSNGPFPFSFDDDGGRPVEERLITVGWEGERYRLFEDSSGIYAINEAFLAPFDGHLEYVNFCRQPSDSRRFLLGVRVGLQLQAVIAPSGLLQTESFIEKINALTTALAASKTNTTNTAHQASGYDAAAAGESQQMELSEYALDAAGRLPEAYRGVTITGAELEAAAGSRGEEGGKTQLGDCIACLCNTCANIGMCTDMPYDWTGDGIRPYPCADCSDGWRYTELDETCVGYVKAAS